jgi:hypothetical protein
MYWQKREHGMIIHEEFSEQIIGAAIGCIRILYFSPR